MIVGFDIALAVLERDRLLADVERELAERALAVFPTVVGLFEEVVGHRLDEIARGGRGFDDRARVEVDVLDCDVSERNRDFGTGSVGCGDRLDLARIPVSVETHADDADAGVRQRLEQRCLVGGEDFGLQRPDGGALCLVGGEIGTTHVRSPVILRPAHASTAFAPAARSVAATLRTAPPAARQAAATTASGACDRECHGGGSAGRPTATIGPRMTTLASASKGTLRLSMTGRPRVMHAALSSSATYPLSQPPFHQRVQPACPMLRSPPSVCSDSVIIAWSSAATVLFTAPPPTLS